jgi:hypothetical protein
MPILDLDALLGPVQKPKKMKGPWWIVGPPPEGCVPVHEVVRRVFGSAYIPLDVVTGALALTLALDEVVVEDASERRVKVSSPAVMGEVVRPDIFEPSRVLCIKQALVLDLERSLIKVSRSLKSELAVSSLFGSRSKKRKASASPPGE